MVCVYITIYLDVDRYTHTHAKTHSHNGILLSHKKRMRSCYLRQHGCYAKWNKSDR